jgi:hypothetical protein
VNIAWGLGQKGYVAELSAGGTLTAWIAQNRSEVTHAVLIAPALGLTRREGTHLQKAMALLFPLLPDIRTDWFSVDPDAPGHTYPNSQAWCSYTNPSAGRVALPRDRCSLDISGRQKLGKFQNSHFSKLPENDC